MNLILVGEAIPHQAATARTIIPPPLSSVASGCDTSDDSKRREVGKSPPHTARIALLMELFPDARFVHIRRDPFVVFGSTRHMIRATQPLYHLRSGPIRDSDDRIIAVYAAMYDAYFAERRLIPAGRLCEVGFEDLERDPMGVMGSIYEALGLPGFAGLRPRLEGYLGSLAVYRKNRQAELPEPLRRRIVAEWGRAFAKWGYGC